MISSELLEVLVSISILITCISYMFMGCAGHRRRGGEESMAADSQATPSEADPNAAGSQAESGATPSGTGTTSQAGIDATPQSSIAGYQSQTSEILAGPGEDMGGQGSTISSRASSRASSVHGHHSSKLQSTIASGTSRLASTLSRATNASSKFGSTLDSNLKSSRANASGHGSTAGGHESVLSMMSRAGRSALQSTLSRQSNLNSTLSRNQSNLESTLSSQASGNRSSAVAPSRLAQSNLDSGWKSKAKNSNLAQSIISASSNFGKSKAGSSFVGSNISPSSKAGPNSNLSRLVTSSLVVSGSSPVSNVSNLTGSSAASGAGGASSADSKFSARSAVTPQSANSQQSTGNR